MTTTKTSPQAISRILKAQGLAIRSQTFLGTGVKVFRSANGSVTVDADYLPVRAKNTADVITAILVPRGYVVTRNAEFPGLLNVTR